MPAFLIASGSFLIGVLWMDLLFDTQIVRIAPEAAVTVISGYYANATTAASPLNRLVGVVMVFTVGGALYQLLRGRIERRLAIAAFVLSIIPVSLAIARVLPNAIELGQRRGSIAEQIALARSICFDHMLCLAMMAFFVTIEITLARRQGSG
jgi:hypothetical protein